MKMGLSKCLLTVYNYTIKYSFWHSTMYNTKAIWAIIFSNICNFFFFFWGWSVEWFVVSKKEKKSIQVMGEILKNIVKIVSS